MFRIEVRYLFFLLCLSFLFTLISSIYFPYICYSSFIANLVEFSSETNWFFIIFNLKINSPFLRLSFLLLFNSSYSEFSWFFVSTFFSDIYRYSSLVVVFTLFSFKPFFSFSSFLNSSNSIHTLVVFLNFFFIFYFIL